MNIRPIAPEDHDQVWSILEEVIRSGDTYAIPSDTPRESALPLWIQHARETYVCESEGQILGTYYLRTNQPGPGNHVCNCGYMVRKESRGQGLATLMCTHSMDRAVELGYMAMQFNFVASSNSGAIHLWERLGFETVGRLPRAFHHPRKGYIDALIMFKWLANSKKKLK